MKLEGGKITYVCIISSTLGLALIYFAAIKVQPLDTELGDIDSELIGRTVRTTGHISYKSLNPAGHVFLTLSDGRKNIEVPLFAGFVNKLAESGLIENQLSKGVQLSVSGVVDEYKGSLQIVPRKVSDVQITGDAHNT
jgi:DNA/RNA endonuclease YhcR with UshA esterase domain